MKKENKNLPQRTISTSVKLIPITKTTDLLRAAPIVSQILECGRNDVEVEISKYVTKCIQGLGLQMDNYSIQLLTEDIVEKYKYDSIEDVQICLKKGRQGYYGTTYNKLNMVVISEWMTKHLEEKAIIREREVNKLKLSNDFPGWATREDYEKAAMKPTKKKNMKPEIDEDYRRFKAEYEAKKKRQ
jgi:hypothetical protein